ncbi:hypothetical protein DRQ50_03610, partial [bacterium]
MAKHLLIIAYAFPPNSAVGSMRPLRVTKSLAGRGSWRTTVISVRREARRRDDDLLQEVPPGTEIHRVRTFEPLRLLEQRRAATAPPASGNGTPGTVASTPPPAQGGLRAWIRDFLSTPDTEWFWVLPVVLRAVRLHLQQPFDAVMVTSPPWSAQFAGRALASLLRIPWIADYRDPWADIDRGHRTATFENWNRKLEDAVLPHASAVVSTSATYSRLLRQRFADLDPGRFVTIHNGFDETKIQPRSLPGHRRLTIVHLGTIYEIWHPWSFFTVLSDWLDR